MKSVDVRKLRAVSENLYHLIDLMYNAQRKTIPCKCGRYYSTKELVAMTEIESKLIKMGKRAPKKEPGDPFCFLTSYCGIPPKAIAAMSEIIRNEYFEPGTKRYANIKPYNVQIPKELVEVNSEELKLRKERLDSKTLERLAKRLERTGFQIRHVRKSVEEDENELDFAKHVGSDAPDIDFESGEPEAFNSLERGEKRSLVERLINKTLDRTSIPTYLPRAEIPILTITPEY